MKTPRRLTDDDNGYMYDPRVHGRNPGDMDMFIEEDGAYYQSDDEEAQEKLRGEQELAQKRVNKLLTQAEKILTPQQYQVFVLIGVQCVTQKDAAVGLGISQQRVAKLWDRCRTKLAELEGSVYASED